MKPKLKRIFKLTFLVAGSLALIYLAAFVVRKARVAHNQKIATAHFDISYSGILTTEANEISDALEANYHRIRKELSDPPHPKISVFVHATQEDFNKASGLPNSHANGTSRGPLAFHLKYETWFNSIFPQKMEKVAVHEFTHCVQLNILIQDALAKNPKRKHDEFEREFEEKFSKEYPQWLWEALSDYEAGMINKASVKHGMKNKPTLQQLNSSNQVYNVGYTIIEYFVNQYGREKLPDFIKSYGDFEKILGVSEKQFESGWHRFVDQKY